MPFHPLRRFQSLMRRFRRNTARHDLTATTTRPCLHCGWPHESAGGLCPRCAARLWRDLTSETTHGAQPSADILIHIAEQPTQPVLRIVAPAQQPAERPVERPVDLSAQVDHTALAGVTPVPVAEDDLPFPDGNGYPDLSPSMYIRGEVDGVPSLIPLTCLERADEFSEDVMRVRLARETLPPLREDWSSRCPWCAREMRELSDDTYTHTPQRETLATCPRHHAAQLALLADLRGGDWQTRFDDEQGGDALTH